MRIDYAPLHRSRRLSLAMTPMIDVVFLLLIFFICTANFQPVEQSLPTSLVLSGQQEIDAPVEEEPELEEVILLGETRGGGTVWSVNGQPTADAAELGEMLNSLASIDRGLPVIVDADGQTPLGEVINVYDTSRAAGFLTVRFAAGE